jgi:hypothetical protein
MGQYSSLRLRPGAFRNGTKYQSQARWYLTQLVRWNEGVMQPVGKWGSVLTGTNIYDIGEPIRGAIGWRGNDEKSRLVVGTATKAYGYIQGSNYDITPAGFTVGGEHAVLSSGDYGDANYSAGDYGIGDEAISDITEANTWQLDTWGDFIIACAYSDGKLYYWDKVTTNNLTLLDASAPTTCSAVVVTPERFVVALGADGESRKVHWCDQGDYTDWDTTSATNQAGDFYISSPGGLMCGRRSKNETLLWTDVDLWAMRYIGSTLVYSFPQLGQNCGIISRHAVAMVDGKAYWMGPRGFFKYDGFVSPLPSEVGDYVFTDMNRTQRSQISCMTMSDFKEIWWFYPSSGSEENDRYVIYNYVEGHWSFGELERTSGFDRGPYSNPIWADGQGQLWKMESGDSYIDVDQATTLVPLAESGPIEIRQGNQVYDIVNIIPDEKTQGDLDLYVFTSYYPNESETENGPYTPANPTNVRLNGRQMRLKIQHDQEDWRFGIPRIEIQPGGRR